MEYDNPAARLLAILENGKKEDVNSKCRVTWKKLLKVSDKNDALLMSRLGKIMELPEQIIEAIKEGFPNQRNTWSHWSSHVNKAFLSQNINGDWNSFISHIDDHSISYLRMSVDLLQTKATTNLIADADLLNIKEKIIAIQREIASSEIDENIKKYLIRYLNKILIGIDEYSLTGALPLLDVVETMVGHTASDANYKNFLLNTELGVKIVETLGAMANVVTVAVGIPQLTQTITWLTN